jgi:hypothetical protein
MGLRANWLNRVLNVPYIPILGPAHPDQFTAEMFIDVFADILTASRIGIALPFDKDRRWSPHKTDTVLVDEIVHRPDYTIIPTLSRRGRGIVKTFYYGHRVDIENLRAATRRCCQTHGAASGRVVWFDTAPTAAKERTHLLLKEFARADMPDPPTCRPGVRELDDCEPELANTFKAFAHTMADHGFGFLQRRREASSLGPVFVTQDDGTITGAIGPLTIMPDRTGARMLLPQYFGVLPRNRVGGHGRALWAAAAHWGTRHRADYQLLQARVGAPSEHLFLSEGLRSLGYATTVAA